MLFWIIAAALTLGVCLAVLLPLIGGVRGGPAAGDHDLEVYRDQLAELDLEVTRGLIQPAEAVEARAEVGRRILRLAAGGTGIEAKRPAHAAKIVATVAVLSVPLVSWGLYGKLGSPDLPSQPLAARLASRDRFICRCADRPRRGPPCRKPFRWQGLGRAGPGLYAPAALPRGCDRLSQCHPP